MRFHHASASFRRRAVGKTVIHSDETCALVRSGAQYIVAQRAQAIDGAAERQRSGHDSLRLDQGMPSLHGAIIEPGRRKVLGIELRPTIGSPLCPFLKSITGAVRLFTLSFAALLTVG